MLTADEMRRLLHELSYTVTPCAGEAAFHLDRTRGVLNGPNACSRYSGDSSGYFETQETGMESTSSTVAIIAALARGIELAGIAVMLLGGLLAIWHFLLRLLSSRDRAGGAGSGRGASGGAGGGTGGGSEAPFDSRYRELRANLGRAILLGLEFLVAADIIGTVAIEPSFRSLGVLALIVAIRTFLSFSLELEISGRWPWQHAAAVTAPSGGAAAGPRPGGRDDDRPPAS